MKCYVCHRNIRPGLESQKRIEERLVIPELAEVTPPAEAVLFGEGQPGGSLDKATGPLIRAWHSKCFHAGRKREKRGGDAVLGTRPEFAALLDWDDPDALQSTEEEASEDQRGNRGPVKDPE